MKYKINTPYNVGSGYVHDNHNTPIPMAQVAPKVGDTVEGEVTDVYIFGKMQRGISVAIGAPGVAADKQTRLFIPESALVPDGAGASSTAAAPGPASTTFVDLNALTIGGALVGIVAGIAVYKYKKQYSFLALFCYCLVGLSLGLVTGQVTSNMLKK